MNSINIKGLIAKAFSDFEIENAKLRARVAELEAEIKLLKWKIANNLGLTCKDVGDLTIGEASAELILLRAELESAKADTDLLDWVEKNGKTIRALYDTEDNCHWQLPYNNGVTICYPSLRLTLTEAKKAQNIENLEG